MMYFSFHICKHSVQDMHKGKGRRSHKMSLFESYTNPNSSPLLWDNAGNKAVLPSRAQHNLILEHGLRKISSLTLAELYPPPPR